MVITFNNKELRELANNDKAALKSLGKNMSKKFKRRLNDLFDATTLEDLRYLAGNYHELTADRKGTWACDLDQPYRLIFRPHEEPIPVNNSGRYLWSEIRGVEILEICNYH